MSGSVSLSERHQHILRATIRHYIVTAEPVGSKVLAEEYNLRVSPATIRNAMGYLEKAGLLYQPHTSAGRVPSDFGYRIYVDQLITPSEQVARQAEKTLNDRLAPETWNFETLLRRASQFLSTLSGYVALITVPQTSLAKLRHVQLVQTDPGQVMLIVVTDSYETQSVLMRLSEAIKSDQGETLDLENEPELIERELQILSNFLNHHLRGKSLPELAALDWDSLDREFQKYADSLRTLMAELVRRYQSSLSTQLVVSGISEVMRQPEFTELQQIQSLVQLLESQQDEVWHLIFDWQNTHSLGQPHQAVSEKRVTVRIGSENPLEPMRTCALISTTYQRGMVPVGSIGLLGPTRMMYEDAIALVETTADYLSEALN